MARVLFPFPLHPSRLPPIPVQLLRVTGSLGGQNSVLTSVQLRAGLEYITLKYLTLNYSGYLVSIYPRSLHTCYVFRWTQGPADRCEKQKNPWWFKASGLLPWVEGLLVPDFTWGRNLSLQELECLYFQCEGGTFFQNVETEEAPYSA